MGFDYISLKDFRKNPNAFTIPQVRDQLCAKQKLSEKFMREMKDYVNWYSISIYQKLSEDFIDEMKDYVDWMSIWGYQNLSEKFVRRHLDRVNWREISYNYKVEISKDFIIEFIDKLDLVSVIMHHFNIQTEEMYRIFLQDEFYNLKIGSACSHHLPSKISKDFIREFRNKLNLDYKITKWFNRDENFYKEFYDKIGMIGWEHISFCNNSHSYNFLSRFKEDIKWNGIKLHYERYLTQEQKDELSDYKTYLILTL